MSGGSQHNPNGRQSQIGPGWSPLQVANFLARAPQAHMASERGVTWHTPTPPPRLYHAPAPSPPDPIQAMKNASNSVFRHTATPPELYRHTPTPPDKHLMRHTPSPGDVKSGTQLPPTDLFPHLGPGREKLRPEDLLAYARGGVDLSLSGARNGSERSPGLSVRDAPTINSLIARAAPRHSLLERLVPGAGAPGGPHGVIVHPRPHTPSPPSSNEDSTDSTGVPTGSRRKRKPERIIRVPVAPPPPASPPRASPPRTSPPRENGHDQPTGALAPPPARPATPPARQDTPPPPPDPHARRKTRSGSAETIDDIAAMIASTKDAPPPEIVPEKHETEPPVTIDKLKSVLASPTSPIEAIEEKEKAPTEAVAEIAAAPKRRSARLSNSESTNVPVESPSEAKSAEPDTSEPPSAEPTASSFVEVENQLEKMFAGIEEPKDESESQDKETVVARKRRKSAPTKGERKAGASESDGPRRKMARKKGTGKGKKVVKDAPVKDAYDSGSNASSSRSRGPYIQIRGPRDSPLSVSVINATTGDEEGDAGAGKRKGDDFRNGLRVKGLHQSTLGLRYDATTPDATWVCAFCERGPHANGMGDLFGPYKIGTDCEEYLELDEETRQRYPTTDGSTEVWLHLCCGLWAPGVVAHGARVWGLAAAAWRCRVSRCVVCRRAAASIACAARGCTARAHLPCARAARWTLDDDNFRAMCPKHSDK